jgi:hypothetical protein
MKKYLDLKTAFASKTGLILGQKIYNGNGEIYRLERYPNRLIKIVTCPLGLSKKRLKILRTLQRIKSPAVVKIFKVGILSFYRYKSCQWQPKEHKAFYYVMEKLSLLSYRNRYELTEDLDKAIFEKKLLDSKYHSRFHCFVKRAQELPFYHNDLHGGNVAINKQGTVKFIDLESFKKSRWSI